MPFKVAVVGHSQVPITYETISNVEIKVFKRSGALVDHMFQPPLSNVFEYRPDLVFLFLGANDIAHHTHDPVYVSDKLSNILKRLAEVCAQVRFVNLERRHYALSNHFNLRNDEYERCRRFINQRMRRYCKWAHVWTINITSPWFYNHLSGDGIHFDNEASLELRRKILYVIRRCLAERQNQ